MFLRRTERKKDGKSHSYWSIVENKRVAGGRTVQRHVLYLGEINSSQAAAWRKAIEVFDEDAGRPRTLALFAEDRCEVVGAGAATVQLRLSDLRLCRPRQWGACWLAGQLWHELQLDRFWAERLPPSRKNTRWDEILQVLVSYRLIAPGSEWRLHREWFGNSAMADLLGGDFGLAEAHKLYACHDLLLEHKEALFSHLVGTLARPVQRRVRRAALRPDEHLLRGQRVRPARGHQAAPRLQPRQAAGLPAGGDRPGGHAGGLAAGLRGAARQHRRQQDAAAVPRQHRAAVRQGAAGLGDGSRRADRGGAGRDAQQRSAGAVYRRHAQGTLEPSGEAPARQAVAGGAPGRAGQAAGRGRRALCLRPEPRPGDQGTRHAPAPAEVAVEAAAADRRHGDLARGAADEARRRALEGAERLASRRCRDRQAHRRLHLRSQSQEAAQPYGAAKAAICCAPISPTTIPPCSGSTTSSSSPSKRPSGTSRATSPSARSSTRTTSASKPTSSSPSWPTACTSPWRAACTPSRPA